MRVSFPLPFWRQSPPPLTVWEKFEICNKPNEKQQQQENKYGNENLLYGNVITSPHSSSLSLYVSLLNPNQTKRKHSKSTKSLIGRHMSLIVSTWETCFDALNVRTIARHGDGILAGKKDARRPDRFASIAMTVGDIYCQVNGQ